ncbi:MAG: CinA family nicotinamide mononucleotide deamidase-related protein [Desulfarculus sp.]|nr:CinA family nicotinamide mononucleotide deamidase-related protein [Desulfarculus sp.]
MRGEIICIGDELISGRVAESNSRYAAARLWPLDIGLAWVVMVGDDPAAIQEALAQACARADYLIVSGGLGTTEDDLTAAQAARFLGLELAEHPQKLQQLEDMLRPRGRDLTPEIRRMASMPSGARPLDPRSAGFALNSADGRPLYFLPGVPLEFRRIMEHTVLPELAARAGAGVVARRELRVYGLPESEVGRRLAGLTQSFSGAGLGYYPVFPEVHLILSQRAAGQEAASAALEPLEAEVRRRLEGHVVAQGGASLEQTVAALLSGQHLTLALAESCTGGLIGHRLTSVPGASDFLERGLVVYSNRAKAELLDVSPATLETHGAVSAQCAQEMAQGARQRAGVDVGLAVTGIAGPTGGSEQKPVGTVFFGLSHAGGTQTLQRRFYGDRAMVKAQAAETALDLLRRYLEEHAPVRGS